MSKPHDVSAVDIHPGEPVTSSTPASNVSTMWSLSMSAVTRVSSSKRPCISPLATICGNMTLSARRLRVVRCTHSYTAPIPPALRQMVIW
jgi:hypothetical protein